MCMPYFLFSTIFKILSYSIKQCSCTRVLSVLPIAHLGERQTEVLKVVGSNQTW